jgi:hypothetical protein
MKFKLLFSLLILLIIITNVHAVSTDMKSEYLKKETGIIKISGNILSSIQKEDIGFFRGHVEVPVEFDIEKLEGEYYLWFISPGNENVYTLKIKKILTTENGNQVEIDYAQDFVVGNKTVEYNLKPGVVFSREDFEIDIESFIDSDILIDVEGREILIGPGKNTVEFKIDDFSGEGFGVLNVGDYAVPSYIKGDGKISEVVEESLPDLRFKPREIEVVSLVGGERIYPIQIINTRDEDVACILEYDKTYFNVEQESFIIPANDFIEVEFEVLEGINEGFEQVVYAKGDGFELELPFVVEFTEEESKVDKGYLGGVFEETSLYMCAELGGEICQSDRVCNGEEETSKDGACCLGSCQAENKDSSYSWVGYLVVGIVILIGIFVWMRYKKARGKDTALDRAKK